MRLVRFLRNLWREQPELQAEAVVAEPVRPNIARPRIHRKMVPVVRYLETLHNRNSRLTFRYVGPNEMNGQAEEVQVYIEDCGEERGFTIRYRDSLQAYFIGDPREGRALQTDEGRILASLADILAEILPGDDRRDLPSA